MRAGGTPISMVQLRTTVYLRAIWPTMIMKPPVVLLMNPQTGVRTCFANSPKLTGGVNPETYSLPGIIIPDKIEKKQLGQTTNQPTIE